MAKIKTKAVLFDFDGTLTVGNYNNIWKALYQVLGYPTDRNSSYYLTYVDFVNGKFDYEKWVSINEADFKAAGLRKETFDQVMSEIKLIDGLETVLETLKQKGIKTFVLSGNFKYLIKRVLGDLADYFEDISANDIIFDENGNLEKVVATKFDYEGKPDYIKKVMEEHSLAAEEICFVGNGENDGFAYRSGAKTICINPDHADEENQEKWAAVIKESDNLKDILEYIE